MCRQNLLFGLLLAAFGLGLLVGSWVEGGFLFHCLGFGLIVGGVFILRKR